MIKMISSSSAISSSSSSSSTTTTTTTTTTTNQSTTSLAIVGDGSVGKSSIIEVFRNDGFELIYKQTIGIDFYEKKLRIRGDIYVSLRVWDIGGQSINSKNLKVY